VDTSLAGEIRHTEQGTKSGDYSRYKEKYGGEGLGPRKKVREDPKKNHDNGRWGGCFREFQGRSEITRGHKEPALMKKTDKQEEGRAAFQCRNG